MGRQIIFCHGCPGSPKDAALAFPKEWAVIAPDFLKVPNPIETGLHAVSGAVEASGDKVTIVGFSIGAMVAIKIARRSPENVGAIVLLSPAAPLQLGDYLERMAGRPVFELARKWPSALHGLAIVQLLALRLAPLVVLRQLFRDVGATERRFVADAAFRRHLIEGLASSLGAGRANYVELLRSYVADWRSDLDNLAMPVEIWHGAEDRWAPVSMAHDLAFRIGSDTVVNILPGHGHYASLTAFRAAKLGEDSFRFSAVPGLGTART